MSTKVIIKSLVLSVVALYLLGCGSKNNTPKYPAEILNIISLKQIDTLKQLGMIINEGNNPPKIEGIYTTNVANCIGDNGEPQRLGIWRDDYKFRFYNQDNAARTIELDYKTVPDETVDNASGQGAFIIGEGNRFTIFMQTSGVQDGVPYKYVYVFSGQVNASTGHIIDWYDSLTLTDKTGDEKNVKLIPIGTTRVFVENDGVASSISSFRIGAENKTAATGKSAAAR